MTSKKNKKINKANESFDLRRMERVLKEIGCDIFEDDDLKKVSPIRVAQEIIYQAWETPTKKERIKLARRALSISKLCADAYNLLAEESDTLEDMVMNYALGMKAGEEALGPKKFREYKGRFWGFLETRPYMRARAGVAQSFWELGARDDAIKHYQAMLELNPNDNQGIRYLLINALLAEGRLNKVNKLLKEYGNEPVAFWLYPQALILFAQYGSGQKSLAALKQAIRHNSKVPLYLLGKKKIPLSPPPSYTLGGEDEATAYACDAFESWQNTAGALEWLAKKFS